MIIRLKKSYKCIYGLPVIHSVDTEIFELSYFAHCMICDFCHDQCCSYGADIDMLNVNRILKHKNKLEKFTGIKKEKWFYPKLRKRDHEYPGFEYTRTAKYKNSCIFLNKQGRGCYLHSFALSNGIDYHKLKPFFCTIFPVTYFEGVLLTPEEIDDKITACLGEGISLYRGARKELEYYFGSEMTGEIDGLEKDFLVGKKSA